MDKNHEDKKKLENKKSYKHLGRVSHQENSTRSTAAWTIKALYLGQRIMPGIMQCPPLGSTKKTLAIAQHRFLTVFKLRVQRAAKYID